MDSLASAASQSFRKKLIQEQNKKQELLLKRREQDMRVNQQRSHQDSSQQLHSSNRLPFGAPTPLGHITSPIILSPTGVSRIGNQLQSEELYNSVIDRSFISNHVSWNQPQTTWSLKMFLAAVGKTPTGEQSTIRLPLLCVVATAGNTTFAALTIKIGRNMKMLAENFSNYDHCISIATNFLTVTLATIIGTLNSS